MEEEKEIPEVYYAFNSRGTRIIAGPFETRREARRFSKRVGAACRYCVSCSGGMTICRACICRIFEEGGKQDQEESKSAKKAPAEKKPRRRYPNGRAY